MKMLCDAMLEVCGRCVINVSSVYGQLADSAKILSTCIFPCNFHLHTTQFLNNTYHLRRNLEMRKFHVSSFLIGHSYISRAISLISNLV